MRSIPISAPLPRIRRARGLSFRPQTTGLLRRTYVKYKVRIMRSAGMGFGGAKAFGPAGMVCRAVAHVFRGVRAINSVALGGLAALYRGCRHLSVPILAVAALAGNAAGYVEHHIRAQIILHKLRRHGRLAPALLMMAFTVALLSVGFLGLGLEVKMDGVSLGFVQSREEISQLIREVEERAAEYTGAPYVISPDISYSLRYLDADNMLDTDALKSSLFSTVTVSGADSGWVLKVNGEILGGSASKPALESMLDRIMRVKSFSDDDMKTEFVQDVRIEAAGSVGAEYGSIADAEAILLSNSEEVQTYIVQNGDTVSGVAKYHAMSVSEIRMLNPNINVDRISIGEEIQVSAAVPFISLRQMRTETYDEEIPFETIIEYDSSMYVNQSKITRAGVLGLASVTADVVYVDGVVSGRDILQYTVLTDPQAQIKVVGSKALPAKAATGTFRKPSNGKFSSGYGYRKNLGDNHTGVDFAGKVGTSIWASDGGTVTFAGWKGNYGYCVIINHGNGYQTLYAHCSSLLVTKGQKVAAGETIAKVGNTGRSTGPHVHFEIIYNGKTVNPLNYINK